MSLSLKTGPGAARINGLRPEVNFGIFAAWVVYQEHGFPLCVTAGIDGKHMRASLHYAGCAVDLRTRDIPPDTVEAIRKAIQERLGDDFDVILEDSHIHMEWNPKQSYTEA